MGQKSAYLQSTYRPIHDYQFQFQVKGAVARIWEHHIGMVIMRPSK